MHSTVALSQMHLTVALPQMRSTVALPQMHLTVALPQGNYTVCLDMTMPLVKEQHEIEGKPYLSYTYGPLLLAADTHYGCALWREADAGASITAVEAGSTSLVHFVTDGLHLVDFASAGGNDPAPDQYTVFIPMK